MKLSIIIPVFNEEKTIIPLLKKVEKVTLPKVTKEIIIVNDASTDTSKEKLQIYLKNRTDIKVYHHSKNMGKGAAVRTGISHATGKYIVIQDADLEYNPQDIKRLLQPILNKEAEVVYGSRLNRLPNFKKDERTPRFFIHYLGNKFLSLLTTLLYGQKITDMETCYKLFPKSALEGVTIHARGFEFEPEITAKLLKKGYSIHEIPISTTPRTYEEGKKLNTVVDGAKALRTLLKYRR